MDEPCVIENFYGVYLLYSLNDKHLGKTYIGFTVNPKRRISQHNKGLFFGGAKKTNNKGPWKMVLVVHGFPNSISALRFEWAWQNPKNSRRLHHVSNKRKIPRKESFLEYSVRILSEMLRVGPWNRLPLTIRWLESEYFVDFMPDKSPPSHMPICFGTVKSKKLPSSQNKIICSGNTPKKKLQNILCDELKSESDETISICDICIRVIRDCKLSCLNCSFISHLNCLADKILKPGEYIPIESACPRCDKKILWGDLIRKMKGCNDLKNNDDSVESEDESENVIEDNDIIQLDDDRHSDIFELSD